MRSRAAQELAGPAHLPGRPLVPRVSVVIPTFNEARNLPYVLGRLPTDVHEVIVVDGDSTDGTTAAARKSLSDVRIVKQSRRGKGNALSCGFAACEGEIAVMLDGDGSMDPSEIPLFVAALRAGADFVKGTRYACGAGSSDITRIRSSGNRSLKTIVNLWYGADFTDLCYGYNAFWLDCLPALRLGQWEPGFHQDEPCWGDGFEIETMLNVRAVKAGLRVLEVPSYESSRLSGMSNLNAWRDGLQVLATIYRERPLRSGLTTPLTEGPAQERVIDLTGASGARVTWRSLGDAESVAKAG